MKQGVILLLLFSFYNNVIYSQQKIERNILSGKVTDVKTGAPLPGASIFIHDSRAGAVADNNGFFKTSSIAAGTFLVEISSVGYETIIESVKISGATEMNFSMQPAAREQEGVTVTGVSTPTRLRQ